MLQSFTWLFLPSRIARAGESTVRGNEGHTWSCHPIPSIIAHWPEEISKPARLQEGETLSRAGWEEPQSRSREQGPGEGGGGGGHKTVVVLQSHAAGDVPLLLPGILVPRMDHRGYRK